MNLVIASLIIQSSVPCPLLTSSTNKRDREVGEAQTEAEEGEETGKEETEVEEVEEKITEMVIEKPNQTREIRGILMISIVQVRITVIVVRNLLRKTPHYVIVSLVTCN